MTGNHQAVPRSCNRCLRKAVCMLYYGELDLRFGKETTKDIVGIIEKLDNDLAPECEFHLEEDRLVKPWFGR